MKPGNERKKPIRGNSIAVKANSIVMYVDMNSYFASCEQQRHHHLRGKPLGVLTYDSPNAAVIAASIEAKRMGVKSGMRLSDCRALCPEMLTITTHPAWYRQIHVDIMQILRKYCDDVIAKSIDEALMNFTSYRLVYNDFTAIARKIKEDIKAKHDYLTCSIGIAPNSFLAKLATEIQKPDGLIEITPENVDGYLAKMQLTDLPGIARNNERRLQMIGIKNPLEMRHSSEALLRKAFGGIVGNYWHKRLNFMEVDVYTNPFKTMSAGRSLGRQIREDKQAMDSMLIALCMRLEQRMVKNEVFCKEVCLHIRYFNGSDWEAKVKLSDPEQDGMRIRKYLLEKMEEYEQPRNVSLLNDKVQKITVTVLSFVKQELIQYGLFDNQMRQDKIRRVIYEMKDKYDKKNIIRKGSELLVKNVLKDAVGFGSVKDLVGNDGEVVNKHMLEEDEDFY